MSGMKDRLPLAGKRSSATNPDEHQKTNPGGQNKLIQSCGSGQPAAFNAIRARGPGCEGLYGRAGQQATRLLGSGQTGEQPLLHFSAVEAQKWVLRRREHSAGAAPDA